jgi:hypothetical protein
MQAVINDEITRVHDRVEENEDESEKRLNKYKM